jgi:hypothetical protein
VQVAPVTPAPPAWWKFGHVWLVIAGPAVVVVASFITLFLAIRHPDPVVDADYYRKGVEINKTLGGSPASLAPAMAGRNHAATGVVVPAPQAQADGKALSPRPWADVGPGGLLRSRPGDSRFP